MTDRYQVSWVIDIEADSPEEAALRALAIQRDPNSTALVFEIRDDCGGYIERVDLDNESDKPWGQTMTKDEAVERITALEDMLADLLASAENMYGHHKKDMYPSDVVTRQALLNRARQTLGTNHD